MTGTTKTLHKEELGVSEIERRIKRKVEEKVAHQLRKQELSTKPVRKISPSPSSRDKPSSSPPAKVQCTCTCIPPPILKSPFWLGRDISIIMNYSLANLKYFWKEKKRANVLTPIQVSLAGYEK